MSDLSHLNAFKLLELAVTLDEAVDHALTQLGETEEFESVRQVLDLPNDTRTVIEAHISQTVRDLRLAQSLLQGKDTPAKNAIDSALKTYDQFTTR